MRQIRKKSGTPSSWHTKWLNESGIEKKSPEAVAHEIGMDTLEAFMCYDQLNVPNVSGIELLIRWMQMIEHAVAQNPKKPAMENTGFFLGNSSRTPGGGLTSALAKHVAAEAAKEASVLKEQRKAREEKALLKKQ